MNVTKESISPKKAMAWLQRNVANRPMSPSTVDRYAKAITEGAWKLNGDLIRFNGNGDLIDGQHRLAACVKSGKSIDSYVVRGLEHDAFDTIDQGKKRTIGDVFARDGYKHYTTLASAVRWTAIYARGFGSHGDMLRPDQAHEILESNPSLHHGVDLARRLHAQQKLIHPGALAFLIHETGRVNQDKADEFWTGVVTGENLAKGTPAQLLHRRLVANFGAAARLYVEVIIALGIKAWNCHVSGKPCGALKWAENEEFPVVKHK